MRVTSNKEIDHESVSGHNLVKGGPGAGNVKLMGVVGAFLGVKAVLTAFLYISVIVGINALSVILQHRHNAQFSLKNLQTMLYNVLFTRKLILGTKMLSTDLPRLK